MSTIFNAAIPAVHMATRRSLLELPIALSTLSVSFMTVSSHMLLLLLKDSLGCFQAGQCCAAALCTVLRWAMLGHARCAAPSCAALCATLHPCATSCHACHAERYSGVMHSTVEAVLAS